MTNQVLQVSILGSVPSAFTLFNCDDDFLLIHSSSYVAVKKCKFLVRCCFSCFTHEKLLPTSTTTLVALISLFFPFEFYLLILIYVYHLFTYSQRFTSIDFDLFAYLRGLLSSDRSRFLSMYHVFISCQRRHSFISPK